MMPRHSTTVAATLALLVGAACQADDRPRYQSDDDHMSIVALDGWTHKRERDTLVFVGPDAEGRARHTISIRAVPIDGDWVETRTADRVIPATEQALQGLPDAEVSQAADVGHGRYDGAQFDVAFSPRSNPGQRYVRRHVVLVADHYVFHVMLTTPEGERASTDSVFSTVVHSLREEV